MHHSTVNGSSRLTFWSHVREFAVPASMIESATARRLAGDWSGACATARVDVDFTLRVLSRTRGKQFADLVRADLRQLAPDLLRWHFPRIRPDGVLRPGLTVSLARYRPPDGGDEVHLVARTPPAWADAGQRISLALWERSGALSRAGGHPHPRPDRRFRLDLHRHLWDARRTSELRERCGATQWPDERSDGRATHRWAAEAALLLRAEEQAGSAVVVRLGSRQRVVLDLDAPGITATSPRGCALPVLPDAATWVPPDLELWHAGAIDADRLHPLVRSALLPGYRPTSVPRSPDSTGSSRLVACRGALHRIGVVNGALVALDHDPDEIRREELLAALGGRSLPCLHAIDTTHRHPGDLVDIRARLDHGDVAGALAVVEGLLGPDALLLSGALRDELETAARRKVLHGLYRAELHDIRPLPSTKDYPRPGHRSRPRHADSRRP
ncbi:hypothetical protein SAMN04488074_102286 [Lentzea albidocapillata subsp. violacea]|uniref:Uncharacterized protein n=1 Tax=Lentzea albidocapillata subsp. violacea TaxID=128104 RepID=A0A1G8UFM1_9PSEU|nr:hypothetical protein [Lentzea albidocapillata]SDJ52549.1 hypothetical protein SAMN04488074_102286 [Lentzea albidocapillata subsp. violacea]